MGALLENTEAASEVGEKRHVLRVQHRMRLLFSARRKGRLEGVLRDLSEGGAYLAAREKLFLETEVLLFLPLSIYDRNKLIILPGKIVRSESSASGQGFGYGIAFISPSSEMIRHLQRFLNIQNKNER